MVLYGTCQAEQFLSTDNVLSLKRDDKFLSIHIISIV